VKLVYSDRYDLNLGNHVFPSVKYRLTKEKLLHDQIVEPGDFVEPPPASDDDIALVHHREYLRKLQAGKLSYLEVMRLEIPYSPSWSAPFGLAREGQFWPGDWRSKMALPSMWAEAFTTPTLTTARASAC